MFVVITIAICILIYCLIGYFQSKKENSPNIEIDNRATSRRIFDALTKMQCQPEISDDNHIIVSYQGQYFEFVCCTEPSVLAQLWYPGIAFVENNMLRMNVAVEAANATNLQTRAKVIIFGPDENNAHPIHIRCDISIPNEMQRIDHYLSYLMHECFHARKVFEDCVQVQNESTHTSRRFAGFNSSAEEESAINIDDQPAIAEQSINNSVGNSNKNNRRTAYLKKKT